MSSTTLNSMAVNGPLCGTSRTLNHECYKAYVDNSYSEYLNNYKPQYNAQNVHTSPPSDDHMDGESNPSEDSFPPDPEKYSIVVANTIKRIRLIVPLSYMSLVFVTISITFYSHHQKSKDMAFYSTITGASLSCLHTVLFPTWGFLLSFTASRTWARARSISRLCRSNASRRSRSRSGTRSGIYTVSDTPFWATDFDNIGRSRSQSQTRFSMVLTDVRAYRHLFHLPHIVLTYVCALLWIINIGTVDIWKLVDVREGMERLEEEDAFAAVLACSVTRMLAHMCLVWIWVAMGVASTREWRLKKELGSAYERQVMQCFR